MRKYRCFVSTKNMDRVLRSEAKRLDASVSEVIRDCIRHSLKVRGNHTLSKYDVILRKRR